jgi:hypothetical protein
LPRAIIGATGVSALAKLAAFPKARRETNPLIKVFFIIPHLAQPSPIRAPIVNDKRRQNSMKALVISGNY